MLRDTTWTPTGWRCQDTQRIPGGGNFTSISNLVGYASGYHQLDPMEAMKPFHMEIVEITFWNWRAGHLHHHGNQMHWHQIKQSSYTLEVTSLKKQSPPDTTTPSIWIWWVKIPHLLPAWLHMSTQPQRNWIGSMNLVMIQSMMMTCHHSLPVHFCNTLRCRLL